ncbi:hypothetical protein [Pseudomonas sp. O11]|uniref:hypothetical protein n=1 Tax=Pseudomonas sp. O11 TaxID=3159446 RepID=UPI00387B345F
MDNALNAEIDEKEETIAGIFAVHFWNLPEKIMHSLRDEVNNCTITKATNPGYFFTGEAAHLPKRQQSCLFALTYWHLASKERDTGNFADAWRLLCKSSYFVGLTDGREEPRQTDAARGRSEKSQWRKLQIANLISKNRPVGGWINERNAANFILDDATDLNNRLKMNLTESRLTNLITDWMKEDGSVVRAAFHGTYVIESD